MNRIVHLIDDPNPGGIQSLLDDMSAAQASSKGRWCVKTIDSRLPIRLGDPYDVIVVHYSMAWRKLPALTLLRLMNPRARLIIVEHHYTKSYAQAQVSHWSRFRALLSLSYRVADSVVAVSEAQARWLVGADVIDGDKLVVIPACRNYDRFLRIERRKCGRTPIVVGALGRLEYAKGFDLLIEAFRQLSPHQFELRIAGDGSERDALRALAAGREDIKFVGHLDEPAEFLSGCDLLVVPSRTEPFGLVCAEAKATGLPVIVSAVDGLPEQARGCGLVVRPECVRSLREAIEQLVSPALRDQMGREARSSVQHAWREFLNDWSGLLA